MTRSEFEFQVNEQAAKMEVLGRMPNEEEYAIIEEVYTSHPSIKDVGGKAQIAQLYVLCGMRVIRDMLPTARQARKLYDEVMKARTALERAEAEYKLFCNL